jgi:hypothetical protein
MSFSLAEILTVEERDSVVETLLAVAASLGAKTTSWQQGGQILTLLTTAADKLSELTGVAVEIAKGGFGDLLPSDEWADLWAQSRFDVTRVPATQATGLVNLTNTSLSNYGPLNPGDLIIAHATTGKTYRNTGTITILASVGLADVAVAADEAGIASNAAPATITTVISTLVGVGSSNPLSLLGTDKETTLALVTRSRAKLGALSPNGPKDAYNYVATTPSLSATAVPITRTKTVTTGATVSVYLATAAGAPTAGDVAIVQTSIDRYAEPWVATSTAIAATAVPVPITYQVWVSESQLTSAQIQTAISAALIAWFATLDLGGYVIPPAAGFVYVRALERVIGGATPGILQVSVSAPAANVALTSAQVAVLGAITPTITLL